MRHIDRCGGHGLFGGGVGAGNGREPVRLGSPLRTNFLAGNPRATEQTSGNPLSLLLLNKQTYSFLNAPNTRTQNNEAQLPPHDQARLIRSDRQHRTNHHPKVRLAIYTGRRNSARTKTSVPSLYYY